MGCLVIEEIPKELASRLEAEGNKLDPSSFDFLLWHLAWPVLQEGPEDPTLAGGNSSSVCAPLGHLSPHLQDCAVLPNLMRRFKEANGAVDKNWFDECRNSYNYWHQQFLKYLKNGAHVDESAYEKMSQAGEWGLRFGILWKLTRVDSKCDLGALTPHMHGLPVPCSISRAMDAAHQNLFMWHRHIAEKASLHELQTVIWKELAQPLRIIQWEVMVRQLYAEATEKCADFAPTSQEGKRDEYPNLIPLQEHLRLCEVAWQSEPMVLTPISSITNNASLLSDSPLSDSYLETQSLYIRKTESSIKFGRNEFHRSAPQVPKEAQPYFQDLLETFSKSRRTDYLPDPIEDCILIEDGESTFFTFTSLFRHVLQEGVPNGLERLIGWLKNKNGKETISVPIPFESQVDEDVKDSEYWKGYNHECLTQDLGLLFPLPQPSIRQEDGVECSYCVTPRWHSFLEWLRAQASSIRHRLKYLPCQGSNNHQGFCSQIPGKFCLDELCKLYGKSGAVTNDTMDLEEKFLSCLDPLVSILPIKRLNQRDRAHRSLIASLLDLFLSDGLQQYLLRVAPRLLFVNPSEFVNICLGPRGKESDEDCNGDWIFRFLEDVTEKSEDSAAGPDEYYEVMNRLCRSYLPLEFQLRRGQPFPIQLLVLPYNFTKTPWLEGRDAPTSIAFATVVGSLPPGISKALREGEKDLDPREKRQARQWLAPYWYTFNIISGQRSIGELLEQAEEKGELICETTRDVMTGHEAGNQISCAYALLDHLKVYPEIRGLIEGNLTYTRLFMFQDDTDVQDMGWMPQERQLVSEWLNTLMTVAWKVAVAREIRVKNIGDLIGPINIPKILETIPQYTLVVSPEDLRFFRLKPTDDLPKSSSQKYVSFRCNLARFTLAGLSNAFKWSGIKDPNLTSGLELVRAWQDQNQFRPLSVTFRLREELTKDEGPRAEIEILNGCHFAPDRSKFTEKLGGTRRVLRSVAYNLPGCDLRKEKDKNQKDFIFDFLPDDYVPSKLNGESLVFQTKVSFDGRLVRVAR